MLKTKKVEKIAVTPPSELYTSQHERMGCSSLGMPNDSHFEPTGLFVRHSLYSASKNFIMNMKTKLDTASILCFMNMSKVTTM